MKQELQARRDAYNEMMGDHWSRMRETFWRVYGRRVFHPQVTTTILDNVKVPVPVLRKNAVRNFYIAQDRHNKKSTSPGTRLRNPVVPRQKNKLRTAYAITKAKRQPQKANLYTIFRKIASDQKVPLSVVTSHSFAQPLPLLRPRTTLSIPAKAVFGLRAKGRPSLRRARTAKRREAQIGVYPHALSSREFVDSRALPTARSALTLPQARKSSMSPNAAPVVISSVEKPASRHPFYLFANIQRAHLGRKIGLSLGLRRPRTHVSDSERFNNSAVPLAHLPRKLALTIQGKRNTRLPTAVVYSVHSKRVVN